MALHIIVTAKQVIDPEIPRSAFQVNSHKKTFVSPPGRAPVVNGFDENAVEAALRIKDTQEATVTIVSAGSSFSMEVIKKPLSMGADRLVLVQDAALQDIADSFVTAQVLAVAIKKLAPFDLILCGRQASDWDNAQVPQGIAELLGVPCVTLGKKVEAKSSAVIVERILPGTEEVVECPLPAVVTVSNELGQPRYPTLRGIMAASKKQPTVWGLKDLGLEASQLKPRLEVLDLTLPKLESQCEFIEGETDEEKGRRLALRLREEKLL